MEELGAALAALFRQQELWSQSFGLKVLSCAGDSREVSGRK